ncbi:Nucleotide exchange factor SIL1, partial [Habropoda laboriosa]
IKSHSRILRKDVALGQRQELIRMRANIIILTCLFLLPAIFGNSEKNETPFVPTREWQTVKKGMPIPKGLHIRHSFETGVTEAKLMDSEETEEKDSNENLKSSNTNSLTLHPEKAIVEEKEPVATEKSDLFNHPIEELKARLKKLKQDGGENVPELNVIIFYFKQYITYKKQLL